MDRWMDTQQQVVKSNDWVTIKGYHFGKCWNHLCLEAQTKLFVEKKQKQKRIEVAVCVDHSAGGIDAGGGLIRADG